MMKKNRIVNKEDKVKNSRRERKWEHRMGMVSSKEEGKR